MTKKVLASHDISCFGRCSMQVIFPALSRFGIQVCPLPTALLSTHTGDFEGYSFLDLTDEMKKIVSHWKSLGLKFDAIYSGFLGNIAQIDTVSEIIDCFPEKDGVVLVDPVMGDNGEIYTTYTKEMCAGMKRLCKNAHIITPNLTEAFLLADMEYQPNPSEQAVYGLLEKVGKICENQKKSVIIHGVKNGDSVSTYYFDSLTSSGNVGRVDSAHCPVFYPGCGDLFASLLLGYILNGKSICGSIQSASDFISAASFATLKKNTPHNFGIEFEELLKELDV